MTGSAHDKSRGGGELSGEPAHPHPSRLAVLVADRDEPSDPSGASGTPRLPMLLLRDAEPSLPEILARVDVVDTASTAVLRLVVTAASEPALMVEFDSAGSDPPTGWGWLDLDGEVLARLEPATSRAAVASWARERVEGWSPLRPPWSHPGWWDRASTWMLGQMAADGRPALGPAAAAPALGGVGRPARLVDRRRGLPQVQRRPLPARGDRDPRAGRTDAKAVPEVIAVDADQGWMLMRDLGAGELGEQDESLWHEGVVAHGRIQRSWLGRTDELVSLGLPVRSLTDLAADVEATTEDSALLARLPADRGPVAGGRPGVGRVVPPPRGDRADPRPRPRRLPPVERRLRSGHDPRLRLDRRRRVAPVRRPRHLRVQDRRPRRAPPPRRRLRRRLVDAGSATGPAESLREAAALGLVVGALYQLQTYRALLPSLIGNGADDGLADADLSWINRA